MPNRQSGYRKGGSKYNKQKSGQVSAKLQFLRTNRKAIVDAGGDADAAMGLATAAKTGKRVRELIREFPDFYYAPGKKKFIVEDSNYDMVGFAMDYMPIRISQAIMEAESPWNALLSAEWSQDVPLWYSFYVLFVALMMSSHGTGFSPAANSQLDVLKAPINFKTSEKQKELLAKAFPKYYDKYARYADDAAGIESWKTMDQALAPFEFPDRKWELHVVSATALKKKSVENREGLEVVLFTNHSGEAGGKRFGAYTTAFNQHTRQARYNDKLARSFGIVQVVNAAGNKFPIIEKSTVSLSGMDPAENARAQDAVGADSDYTKYRPDTVTTVKQRKDYQDQTQVYQSEWGATYLNDDAAFYTKATYADVIKMGPEGDVSCVIVKSKAAEGGFFCCRRYPMTAILDAASGLLNSYNWYEQNGFQLTSDKLTIRLGPVKIAQKYVNVEEAVPRLKMAKNMAYQYLPTMYFIDYDEHLMAEYKGKKPDSYYKDYDKPEDRTIGYIRDHFIFLNPELYIIPAAKILQTAELCLKIMDHVQKDDHRLIDGSTQTPAQRLKLVQDYIAAQYNAQSPLGEHLVDFNKTTRSIKNAQFVKDIYCCFIPTPSTLASHHQPTIKVQSNPVFMRSGRQNFLKMFNRTATVFYPTRPLMSAPHDYDATKALASQLIGKVNSMTGQILREQLQTAIPAKFTSELADGIWGLNAHQRPAVVSFSDVVLAKMYTQQMFPETARLVHTHPMGAAALRWSQFENAFGLFAKNAPTSLEGTVMAQLNGFPSDTFTSFISENAIKAMVTFYTTALDNSSKYVNMASALDALPIPSILACERFRTYLVKTDLKQKVVKATNRTILKGLETNTHTYTLTNDEVSFEKRAVADDTMSDVRIQFAVAMNLFRKFFKALKVVQRFNGSSLMTVEGLMQATYSLPYSEPHQLLEEAFSGNLLETANTPSFGGVTSTPDSAILGWKNKMMYITPFGEPVRTRVVYLMSQGKQVNGEPWEKATAAAQAYKNNRGEVSESDKYSSVANTCTAEALKTNESGIATRMTIADQLGFLYTAVRGFPLKLAKVVLMMKKHITEVRNMITLLMCVYTTSTHKGVSDFDIHRLIRQFVNYQSATLRFFVAVIANPAESDWFKDNWIFNVPPPRKFEKYKRQKADDVLTAQYQAEAISQPIPSSRVALRSSYLQPIVARLQRQILGNYEESKDDAAADADMG